MKTLQAPCLRGACMETLTLVSRSCKIRSRNSGSFYGNLVRFSLGPGIKTLPKVLFTIPYKKILWRSCWIFSSRGPCINLEDPLHWCLHENDFGILQGNSCMKILWAPLYRSILKKRSCYCSCDHVLPHLLLFHSYCCLYLLHWLPTPQHCLRPLAGVICLFIHMKVSCNSG